MKDERLAERIASKFEEFSGPFPYADCFELIRLDPQRFEALIPDLDLYFSDIAGYSSGARRLHRRPRVELAAAQKAMTRSFFEKHPEYLPLEDRINPDDVPDLHRDFRIAEELRTMLQRLLAQLLVEWQPGPFQYSFRGGRDL